MDFQYPHNAVVGEEYKEKVAFEINNDQTESLYHLSK
jgi:hypothetical protein